MADSDQAPGDFESAMKAIREHAGGDNRDGATTADLATVLKLIEPALMALDARLKVQEAKKVRVVE